MNVTQPVPRALERYQRKLELMRIAQRITEHGWLIDRQRLAQHTRDATMRMDEFATTFCERANVPRETLGPALSGQTDAVKQCFKDMGAPDVSFDKLTKRPQFNTAALIEWATKDRSAPYAAPAAALYALRKNVRIRSMCNSYDIFSATDGRIHFEFNVLGAQTGRWTSSTRLRLHRRTYKVNAQQVAKKEPRFDFQDGQGERPLCAGLRDLFVADPGCKLIIADYDQLELRLIAYMYGVHRLVEALDTGADIHNLTAHHLWPNSGIRPTHQKADLTPRQKAYREAAKSCAYAISYQMSLPNKRGRYPTLHKTLQTTFPGITEGAVSLLSERFFMLYPEIKAGQLATLREVEHQHHTELAIDGRRLYFPATMRGFNQSLNFPKQGTGAALCDRAVCEIVGKLKVGVVMAQVHDEIVCQAPEAHVNEVCEVVKHAMSRPAQIGKTYAGIPAELTVAQTWAG